MKFALNLAVITNLLIDVVVSSMRGMPVVNDESLNRVNLIIRISYCSSKNPLETFNIAMKRTETGVGETDPENSGFPMRAGPLQPGTSERGPNTFTTHGRFIICLVTPSSPLIRSPRMVGF